VKYIRFVESGFLIFSGAITHKHAGKLVNEEILSAGFVGQHKDGLRCYGQSETLHLKSDPADTDLLRSQIRRMRNES